MMLLFEAFPALLQIILMYFITESPRWLFQHNKKQKAIVALRKFFKETDPKGRAEVESEIYRIEHLETFEGSIPMRQALYELFNIYDRGLLIGILLFIGQQLSGYYVLLSYGPTIMKDAGFGGSSERDNIINTIPLVLVSCITSISTIFLSDK
mgnify:FL=1